MEADIRAQGNLPVRALAYKILQYFQAAHPDFIQELSNEIDYNGLQPRVMWDNGKKAVHNLASLSDDRQITVNEAYLAFLWCLSYAVVTFYNEQQELNPHTNFKLGRAIDLLHYGYSLFQQWSDWDLNLPNPEQPDVADPYIEQANAVMIIAASFVFCHEYAHHYLGHTLGDISTTENDMKADEFAADKHAFDILIEGIRKNEASLDRTVRLAIVIGIGSLLFVDDCWTGDKAHPDTDERVYRLLEMLNGDPEGDEWKFGLLLLMLWNVAFNNDNTDPNGHGSAKEDYKFFLHHLKERQMC